MARRTQAARYLDESFQTARSERAAQVGMNIRSGKSGCISSAGHEDDADGTQRPAVITSEYNLIEKHFGRYVMASKHSIRIDAKI